MSKIRGNIAFTFATVIVIAGNASAITIDDFTTVQASLVRTAPADFGIPISSTVVGGGILGGERDIEVNLLSVTPIGNRISVGVSSYNHSQDGGIRGTSFCVWDGIDGNGAVVNPIGLSGTDLTVGGSQDALQVNIISADLMSTLVFEVFTNAGNSSKYTLSLPGGAVNDVYVIPYAIFAVNLGAGASFSSVGAVTMLVDGSTVASLDVILELIQTTSVLTMQKTDAHLADADLDGNVDVGETIQYTVTLTNPDDDGNAAAPAVIFNDVPDASTALVVGSVTTTQGVVTIGNTGGDTTVSVNVGNIADGASVTIMFSVVVTAEDPLVCNQGSVGLQRTDDPGTPAVNDPTCTVVTFCGDGLVNDMTEECDDGNLNNNDNCLNNCMISECGDGVVDSQAPGIEECDDGNLNNNDNCLNNCMISECGDGVVDSEAPGIEECDDGNLNNNDNCLNNCTTSECGDGVVDSQAPGIEECDDGNLINTDNCLNNCTTSECGDGVVDSVAPGIEECDDGNLNNNDNCLNNCTTSECGDGVLDSVAPGIEECDDGNIVNNDGCSSVCDLEGCGDGVIQAPEECDDGNNVNGDGCQANCLNPECGDGIVDPGEQCDDGNSNNNDLCTNSCTNARCGDGIIQAGEQCDGPADSACDPLGCLPNCTCEESPGDEIPTVSEWGVVILGLLLLTAAKIQSKRSPLVG